MAGFKCTPFVGFAHTQMQHIGEALPLRGGCFDKGFTSLPKDLQQCSQKSHKSIARTSVNIMFPFPWHNTCKKWIETPSAGSFPANRLCFEGGKRKMRGSLWPERKVIIRCLPQGKSACLTSKLEQAEHSKQGLGDCFLLKCSGVQVQVTQRGLPPAHLTTIFRLGWHEETNSEINAWLRGPRWWGTRDLRGRTSSKSNHQSEVVTDLLQHPLMVQLLEPSFLYHQKPSLWAKKSYICLQENNNTLNGSVAMETMWESVLGMWGQRQKAGDERSR